MRYNVPKGEIKSAKLIHQHINDELNNQEHILMDCFLELKKIKKALYMLVAFFLSGALFSVIWMLLDS